MISTLLRSGILAAAERKEIERLVRGGELLRPLVSRFVAGDTLAMRDGALYRNGVRLDEPYAQSIDPDRSEDPLMRARMRAWQVLESGAEVKVSRSYRDVVARFVH